MKWVWCALRDTSLKQARECANQWRSVLREENRMCGKPKKSTQ